MTNRTKISIMVVLLVMTFSGIVFWKLWPEHWLRDWVPMFVAGLGILGIGVLLIDWMDTQQARWQAWADEELKRIEREREQKRR